MKLQQTINSLHLAGVSVLFWAGGGGGGGGGKGEGDEGLVLSHMRLISAHPYSQAPGTRLALDIM